MYCLNCQWACSTQGLRLFVIVAETEARSRRLRCITCPKRDDSWITLTLEACEVFHWQRARFAGRLRLWIA